MRNNIGGIQNTLYISAASVWEMSIKQQLGKLTILDDIESLIEELGFSALPINLFHGQQAGRLPMHHRDPFEHFPSYGVRLINALK